MNKKLTIVLLCAIAALAVFNLWGWGLATQRGRDLAIISTAQSATKAAESAKEKKANEIKNTSPADLVDSSLDSDALKRTRDKHADDLDAQLRARARAILLGGGSVPAHSILGR